ncbi:hypothetical protein MBM74_004600 [Salmonella enterica]|nr:hypothetical protein [Citrobacter portucalensis]EIV9451188.1 hypothetical protein [Salmonella enterica]
MVFINKLNKFNGLCKYIDQFSFALLNVGMIFFASRFLNNDQAAKYIIINSYSSFSLVVIVALVISPFWVFSVESTTRGAHYRLSLYLSVLISFASAIVLSSLMFLREHDWKYSTLIFGLSMCYPLYDFLRRSLYIVKKEFIAAILSLSLFFVTALSYFIMYFCGIRKADDYLLVLIIIMSLTSLSIIFLNRQNYSSSNDKFEIKKVIFDYWKIGKWAAASMLCFWVITQGSFIYLEKIIDNEQLVFTRLALSLSGIIAIYFSAIENKLMPEIREIIYQGNSEQLISKWKNYFTHGLVTSICCTLFVVVFYSIFFKINQYQLSIVLLMCIYQMVSGIFKFSSFHLKAKKLHKSVFYCNFISVIIVILIYMSLKTNNPFVLPAIIIVNGTLSSALYSYFLFINRGK